MYVKSKYIFDNKVYLIHGCVHMLVLPEDVVNIYFVKKVDCHFHTKISIIQLNVQSSSFTHREALHARLQKNRFRFVFNQKFMTKCAILYVKRLKAIK